MSDQLNCESWDILISAMLDGELASSELASLQTHLSDCESCRSQVQEFTQVDSAVQSTGQPGLFEHAVDSASAPVVDSPELNRIRAAQKNASVLRRSVWSPWRLIPMGVAAALLVCFAFAFWPNPQPANANSFSAEEFVGPMIELETLQIQKQNDQDLMLKTLSMDLRSIRLEVNQLEPGSTEHEAIVSQIDAMMEKVRAFQTASNSKPLQVD